MAATQCVAVTHGDNNRFAENLSEGQLNLQNEAPYNQERGRLNSRQQIPVVKYIY